MGNNRRDFIKRSGLAGLGLAGSGFLSAKNNEISSRHYKSGRTQLQNMSGFAAPKMDKVRVGIIGLGQRGPGAVNRLSKIQGVEIKALCDIREDKALKAKERLKDTNHNPDLYFGGAMEWKRICDRDDIDLVYICTPWDWHTPMCVYAMENGKHAATEVPAATTLDECWQLVETSERTKKHCMMLENCCYDFFELLTLNMVRQGYFGDLIHAEGAYIHDLLGLNFNKEGYYQMWRLEENATRDGNLYPTHGLGPVCWAMDINRGDQMDYLVAMSSNDFMMAPHAKELSEDDPFFNMWASKKYRGNMNTTTVKTKKGRTIMIQHDVTSPRPYSRIHLISGTKGVARKYPSPSRIATGHEWKTEEEFKQLEAEYTPELIRKVGDMAKKIGGHGGMDFIMDWRLIDCLRNGISLDQDVYDAALWSAMAPLSEKSVANRSTSVDVPDFTAGAWKTNEPVDITLRGAGTTEVITQ
ncbi:Gfo/Idh/MocA family protein [Membranihabitans maritimus]|uniref:Gfo/Idh/MocA family protein n=1 Tax=Membranihabitans maritimus TaxID=2904244 RepID=UPI001EFFB3E3|nr:Gfo/Idh/MocA family oxidoreductase [Membranihabitans maritimus]